jgi:cellulose synthase/poly-beta-1,6-N-acetylglucosamine synthase-like glycosyltransferase
MGFVQATHAYRGYAESRFGRWANAEYAPFYRSTMTALNEHGAGLTIGTMSLISLRALDEAGGWAEWCLTEDSELAVRIQAAGYDSVYLSEPYGRGLIPPTFAEYRKQRFRWTYGPVQEFYRHWRLYLPRSLGGRPSALTATQKLHHANHGIAVISCGLTPVKMLIGTATVILMILNGEGVIIPAALWAAAIAMVVSSQLLRYLTYRRVLRMDLRQAVGGTIAAIALMFVIQTASLRALLRRPASWQRTAKFRVAKSGLAALRGAHIELIATAFCLATGALLLMGSTSSLVTAAGTWWLIQGLGFAAAPVVALIADRSLEPIAAEVGVAAGHGVQAPRALRLRPGLRDHFPVRDQPAT